MRTMFSKILSLSMSFALVATSMPAFAAPMAVAGTPDFVTALTPSENLGHIDSFYKGSTDRPVVLIQDLHANFGVQQKIRGILEFLQPKVAPTGRTMVLGTEGAWGELDLSNMRQEALKVRKATADYLLKESEMTAMEHFALLADQQVRLVGIDDPESYILHTELFRKSLAARLSLAQKVDVLRSALNQSKGGAPKALRNLWKLEEEFHAGRVDLNTISKKLNANLSTYKEAELALAKAKKDLIAKEEGETAFKLKNITEADQQLSLLGRLLRQQLTMDEVQMAGKNVPSMLMAVRALMPGENMTLWADTIRTAIDHYAVALVRDRPMAEHAYELAQKNLDTSVVIVTGGFHTAGVASFLKERKMSYVVIAPIVESHTLRDEQTYVKRMLDIHVTEAEMAAAAKKSLTAPTLMQATVIGSKLIAQIGERFPRLAVRYDRALSVFRGRTNAMPAATPPEVAQGRAVDILTQPAAEEPIPPSRLASAISTLRWLFSGGVEEYHVTPVNATAQSADQVTLEGQAAAAQQAAVQTPTNASGIQPRRLSLVTSTAITATLAAVAVADRITEASKTTAGMNINQENLVGSVVVGTVFAAGVYAYNKFWADPRKREATKQAMMRARVRIAA